MWVNNLLNLKDLLKNAYYAKFYSTLKSLMKIKILRKMSSETYTTQEACSKMWNLWENRPEKRQTDF